MAKIEEGVNVRSGPVTSTTRSRHNTIPLQPKLPSYQHQATKLPASSYQVTNKELPSYQQQATKLPAIIDKMDEEEGDQKEERDDR